MIDTHNPNEGDFKSIFMYKFQDFIEISRINKINKIKSKLGVGV